jgi:hypothetical protein
VGGGEGARGRGQAGTRDGGSRRGLEESLGSDAAVVGGGEKAQGHGQAAARDGRSRRGREGC